MTRKRNLLIAALAAVLTLGLATAAAAQTCPEPTPAEELASTMVLIGTLDLNPGNINALMQPLSSALTSVAKGDTEAAIRHLATFVNKADAQSGKALTVADADLLIATADEIVATLGAPPPATCPCLSQTIFSDYVNGNIPIDRCDYWIDGSNASGTEAFNVYGARGVNAGTLFFGPHCSSGLNEISVDRITGLTLEEVETCQQLVLQAAAAQGVTCFLQSGGP